MADLTLQLSSVSSAGTTGIVGAPVVGSCALALPLPSLASSAGEGIVGSVSFTLPTPQILCGVLTYVATTLPVPALASAGYAGVVGSVSLTLPTPQLQTGTLQGVNLNLPVPAFSASGFAGVVGSVSLILPTPQPAIVGNLPLTGDASLTLPIPNTALQGFAGNTGSLTVALRQLALAVEGYTGVVGSVSLTLPIVQLGVGGSLQEIGSAVLTLPSLHLSATGNVATLAPVSTVSNTLVMHSEAFSLTTYSNFNFNSYAQFNGLYLAANGSGIFALTGDTDNGALIQAAARVGISDFSTSHLKRIDRVYVGYRTTGDLVLRITTDDVDVRDYRLPAMGKTGLHGNHTRLGKGLVARYWQFEVRNTAGSPFQLNVIELKPTTLVRRVGGRDA